MKYVLIGCGRVAPSHVKAALANGLSVAALCDLDPEKARALARRFDITPAVYTDYREMLRAEKPDFAAIATVSGTHAEIAVDCANAGVNFLVEKPLAMSVEDADRVLAAAEANGVTGGVCHQNRFNEAVQALKNAVDHGRFGRLSHGAVCVRWHRGPDYYAQDAWRGKWATDGGTLMNQCIHGIDLLLWLMGGDAETVYGATRNLQHPTIEGEDVGTAVLTFASGAVATVEGSVNLPADFEETLCLFGETGAVRLGGMCVNEVVDWTFTDGEAADADRRAVREQVGNVYGNGHTSLYLDFLHALAEHRAPYVTLEAGKRAVEIVLAIYKSQKTGLPVTLPLTGFGSADMADVSVKR